MYEQLDIFSYLEPQEQSEEPKYNRLNVGDKIGKLVLGDVIIGTIYKVEGNKKHFFYRTDKGCFEASARTDFEQMEKEAEEIRKQYKTIEIDKFDKFFAVEYPPRECDGYILRAMVGIYQGMLFWKEDYTYQFLESVRNIEKAYKDKVFSITHDCIGEKKEREYKVLDKPIPIKRMYYSNALKAYSEAGFVEHNP